MPSFLLLTFTVWGAWAELAFPSSVEGGGASLRLNRYMLESAEDGSLIETSEAKVGCRCEKGLGVGTRLALGNGVGNRACEGGRFSLLLDIEGWYIVGGLSFRVSCEYCLPGD